MGGVAEDDPTLTFPGKLHVGDFRLSSRGLTHAMPINPEHFNTAENLLERIRPTFKQTSDYSDPWVYRGHFDAGWKLLPAALRVDGKGKLATLRDVVATRLNKVADRDLAQIAWHPDYRRERIDLMIQLAAEVFAVREFCDLADELGLVIPQQELIAEDLDGLIKNVISFSTTDAFGEISAHQETIFVDLPFAFAQHHGIPTRYLEPLTK
jgi:hypothetical protein